MLTASLMMTNNGTASHANGVLSRPAQRVPSKIGTGAYTIVAANPATLTSELATLLFTPTPHQVAPGSSVTTGITLIPADGGAGTNATTELAVTGADTPPTISGVPATQSSTDNLTLLPFSVTTIADPDAGAATSATITLSSNGTATDANGTLFGNGLNKIGVGTYTLAAASPATLTTELQGLTFSPTADQAPSGSSVITDFSLVVNDGTASATASSDVSMTAAAGPRMLEGDFDPAYYLAQYPDVAAAAVDPLLHYETYGWQEGRNPDAYFNTTYYLNQNPDVAAAGIDPLLHYEQYGWKEGRDPSLNFSTSAYLQHNSDVVAANIDPLYHYLQYGATKGRMSFMATPHGTGEPNPLVDNSYYFSNNPDVAAVGINPFTHYDASGWYEGRNPDPLFNTNYYLQNNPDVRAAGIDPLLHYEQYGWQEGRNPSAAFDTNAYLSANPDVRAAGIDPLQHYLDYGYVEGRHAYPVS